MAVSLVKARKGPEAQLLQWLDQIEREGTTYRDQKLGDADRYERLYQGVKATKRDPRFRAGVIGPTVRRRNALLTENKPVIKIEPMIDGLQTAADTLNEIIQFGWEEHGFPAAVEEIVDMGSVFGSAGLSLPMNFKANGGIGAIEPMVRDPRQVAIDPNVVRAKDVGARAKYVLIEEVECVWDIQHEFPGRGMLVKPEMGVSGIVKSPLGTLHVNEAAQTSFKDRIKKLEEGPIPRAVKKTYWIRDPNLQADGEPMFPFGRTIVRCGDIILYDGEAKFFDGEPDLIWLDNRPDFTNVWGKNEIEALRYIQGAVNRIGEMFVDNTILMGNSRVIADSDALGEDALNNLTNVAALILTKRKQSQVTWDPPSPMPPHFLQFISFALRLVDYLVGLSDGGLEGRGRVEMRSGVQLEGLQNAAQVLIRAMARRLEAFMERLGRKFISRVFQFYNGSNRIMLATGPGGQFLKYTLETDKLYQDLRNMVSERIGAEVPDMQEDPSAFSDYEKRYKDMLRRSIQNAGSQFAFRVQPLSSLASTKAARAQMFFQMVEAALLPRRYVLQDLGYSNYNELLAEATQEHAQAAQNGIQMGGGKKGGKKAA